MKSLCFVFPMPLRFFEDMMESCIQLQDYYLTAPVYPLYVSTMKRSYCFENAQGVYGEFETGDQFLIFEGDPEFFNPGALFRSSFPTPEVLRIVDWEETNFHIGIVAVDSVLGKTLSNLGIGVNTHSENEWMLIEDYASFISFRPEHDAQASAKG